MLRVVVSFWAIKCLFLRIAAMIGRRETTMNTAGCWSIVRVRTPVTDEQESDGANEYLQGSNRFPSLK
jgi:hypothetical protein